MEPEGIGGLLGAILAGLGSLAEPHTAAIELLSEAPAEFRPLRLVVPGRLYDVHPGEIRRIGQGTDDFGQPTLELGFHAAVSEWLAVSTGMFVGSPIQILVCGEELSAPVIREPILGGSVVVSGDLTFAENDALLRIIAGQIDCEGNPIAVNDAPMPEPRRKSGRP